MEGRPLRSKYSQYGRPLRSKKQSIWKVVRYVAKTVNMEGRPLRIKKQSIWKAVRYVSYSSSYVYLNTAGGRHF